MILVDNIGGLHISCDFSSFLLISVHLGTSLDFCTFNSGLKMTKNSYFWSKLKAQGP